MDVVAGATSGGRGGGRGMFAACVALFAAWSDVDGGGAVHATLPVEDRARLHDALRWSPMGTVRRSTKCAIGRPSAGAPAPYESRDAYALESGKAVMRLIADGIRPRDICTKKAFETDRSPG